jgi:hypothetical protein
MILSPSAETHNVPATSRTNSRQEQVFEGTRDYLCLARACEQYGDVHTLAWGEELTHIASAAEGDEWAVAVEWWHATESWDVYGELGNRQGPLSKATTDDFQQALARAYKMADTLNAIDAAGDVDLEEWAARAIDATRYEASPYDALVQALGWLAKRPELALEDVAEIIMATNAALAKDRI